MHIRMKRIYETPEVEDGKRILVDRLWPRGVSKSVAQVDEWFKDIAPSPELRTAFCHVPDRFPSFRTQYAQELVVEPRKRALCDQVRAWANEGTVTLVYAARDEVHNHAVVLQEVLLHGDLQS